MPGQPIANRVQRAGVYLKPAIGSGLAWQIAEWTGSGHPYLAPLAVILCLQATRHRSLQASWQRLVGTVVGVLLATLLVNLFGANTWTIGAIVFLGIVAGKVLRLDEQMIHQIGVSAVLVFVFESHSYTYALDRIKDTLIGILVSLALEILAPPPRDPPAS